MDLDRHCAEIGGRVVRFEGDRSEANGLVDDAWALISMPDRLRRLVSLMEPFVSQRSLTGEYMAVTL